MSIFRDKLIVAGPCGAESRQQILKVARELSVGGVRYFRAGLWKPRTLPNTFEGVGEQGLQWLCEARKETSMKIGTEVAKAEHIRLAKEAGLDFLWIGARTTTNPFAVQEIADNLKKEGFYPMVMVKNPVIADIKLWIGAIERLRKAGVKNIVAVHRGFFMDDSVYRNPPLWHIPIEMKRLLPEIDIVCDPSHISGKRELVEGIMQKALRLGFDGFMVETHPDPPKALSDSEQQLTPADFLSILHKFRSQSTEQSGEVLEEYRSRIDTLDRLLIETIAKRMQISKEIGEWKKQHNMQIFQPKRYADILQRAVEYGRDRDISPEFIKSLMELIHQESVEKQW